MAWCGRAPSPIGLSGGEWQRKNTLGDGQLRLPGDFDYQTRRGGALRGPRPAFRGTPHRPTVGAADAPATGPAGWPPRLLAEDGFSDPAGRHRRSAERVIITRTQTGDTRRRCKSGFRWSGGSKPAATGSHADTASIPWPPRPQRSCSPRTTIGRLLPSGGLRTVPPTLPDDPDVMDLILRRLIGTGRCHWHDKDTPPLTLGPARPASWTGSCCRTDGSCPIGSPEKGIRPLVCATVVRRSRPWTSRAAGFGLPAGLAETLLAAPPIAPRRRKRWSRHCNATCQASRRDAADQPGRGNPAEQAGSLPASDQRREPAWGSRLSLARWIPRYPTPSSTWRC